MWTYAFFFISTSVLLIFTPMYVFQGKSPLGTDSVIENHAKNFIDYRNAVRGFVKDGDPSSYAGTNIPVSTLKTYGLDFWEDHNLWKTYVSSSGENIYVYSKDKIAGLTIKVSKELNYPANVGYKKNDKLFIPSGGGINVSIPSLVPDGALVAVFFK